jgi:protein gp37
MGENSSIEWCDHTFNPWLGCTKVSEGCKHCYAEHMMDKRLGKVKWGPQGQRVRTSTNNWREPLLWDLRARKEGKRARVFCASLADVFEDKPDQPEMDEWRYNLLHNIGLTENLDWLLLTKRPENVQRLIDRAHDGDGNKWSNGIGRWSGRLPDNVWIGTSVENQEQADIRIPALLTIPARVRFLSVEPLLGPVDLTSVRYDGVVTIDCINGLVGAYTPHEPFPGETIKNAWAVNWVIVGGESGVYARPVHPDWVRSLRNECEEAGVPFFFKQWGSNPDETAYGSVPLVNAVMQEKKGGRVLDGRTWDEFPQVVHHAD